MSSLGVSRSQNKFLNLDDAAKQELIFMGGNPQIDQAAELVDFQDDEVMQMIQNEDIPIQEKTSKVVIL